MNALQTGHPTAVDPFGAGPPAAWSPPDHTYLQECFKAVSRHRVLAAAIFLTTLSAIVAALFVVQPLYRSTTLAMIEGRSSEVVKVDAVLSGRPADFDTVESEIQVIRSRDMISRLVDELRLATDPEFDPNQHISIRARLASWIPERVRALADAWFRARVQDPRSAQVDHQTAIIENVQHRLQVAPVGRSRVIGISFSSIDPAKAAKIVNSLSELYVKHQLEMKKQATRQANEWINDQLAGLRQQADDAGRAAAEFRAKAGLFEGKDSNSTLLREHLSELNTQLVSATAGRLRAQADLNDVRRIGPRGPEASSDIVNSRLIQALREKEAEIAARRAHLATTLGPQSPDLRAANSELADMQRRIAAEIGKIVSSDQGAYEAASELETSLQSEVQKTTAELAKATADEVRLNQLQQEARADRALYDTFYDRYNQTKVDQSLLTPDVRVISHGAPAVWPYFPDYRILIPIGVVASAIVSMLGLLFIEFRDRGFRSVAQLERALGVQVVGIVPEVPARERNGERASDPVSLIGTAMTDIYMRVARQTPKSLLVTSAFPMEGKTTLSLALARLAVANGKRVLFIDGDLRHSGLRRRSPPTQRPGLSDLLSGSATLADALDADRAIDGLSLLASGAPVKNPAGLLSSDRMSRLLAVAKENFDLVIVDSPAVMAGSDAWVLSQMIDECLFFVRWAQTPRHMSIAAIKQLVGAGAKVAGAVLTMVNISRIRDYSATDGISYSKELRRYYPTAAT